MLLSITCKCTWCQSNLGQKLMFYLYHLICDCMFWTLEWRQVHSCQRTTTEWWNRSGCRDGCQTEQESLNERMHWEHLINILSDIQSPPPGEHSMHEDVGTGLEMPTAHLSWGVGRWKAHVEESLNPSAMPLAVARVWRLGRRLITRDRWDAEGFETLNILRLSR